MALSRFQLCLVIRRQIAIIIFNTFVSNDIVIFGFHMLRHLENIVFTIFTFQVTKLTKQVTKLVLPFLHNTRQL